MVSSGEFGEGGESRDREDLINRIMETDIDVVKKAVRKAGVRITGISQLRKSEKNGGCSTEDLGKIVDEIERIGWEEPGATDAGGSDTDAGSENDLDDDEEDEGDEDEEEDENEDEDEAIRAIREKHERRRSMCIKIGIAVLGLGAILGLTGLARKKPAQAPATPEKSKTEQANPAETSEGASGIEQAVDAAIEATTAETAAPAEVAEPEVAAETDGATGETAEATASEASVAEAVVGATQEASAEGASVGETIGGETAEPSIEIGDETLAENSGVEIAEGVDGVGFAANEAAGASKIGDFAEGVVAATAQGVSTAAETIAKQVKTDVAEEEARKAAEEAAKKAAEEAEKAERLKYTEEYGSFGDWENKGCPVYFGPEFEYENPEEIRDEIMRKLYAESGIGLHYLCHIIPDRAKPANAVGKSYDELSKMMLDEGNGKYGDSATYREMVKILEEALYYEDEDGNKTEYSEGTATGTYWGVYAKIKEGGDLNDRGVVAVGTKVEKDGDPTIEITIPAEAFRSRGGDGDDPHLEGGRDVEDIEVIVFKRCDGQTGEKIEDGEVSESQKKSVSSETLTVEEQPPESVEKKMFDPNILEGKSYDSENIGKSGNEQTVNMDGRGNTAVGGGGGETQGSDGSGDTGSNQWEDVEVENTTPAVSESVQEEKRTAEQTQVQRDEATAAANEAVDKGPDNTDQWVGNDGNISDESFEQMLNGTGN